MHQHFVGKHANAKPDHVRARICRPRESTLHAQTNDDQPRVGRAASAHQASEASAKRESLADAKKQEEPAPSIKEEKKKTPGKISFKEKHEFETLEKNLPLWEEKKAQLEAELLKATDHIQMEKTALELGALSDQIDNGTMRWLELSELM